MGNLNNIPNYKISDKLLRDDSKRKVKLYPQTCNICGHKVIYTSNSEIYGREYGSGKCYLCTNPDCRAYVGTHEPRPMEAFGLLADEQMRKARNECHAVFDEHWKHAKTSKDRKKLRKKCYEKLATDLGILVEECHFGWFDIIMLQKAYDAMMKW